MKPIALLKIGMVSAVAAVLSTSGDTIADSLGIVSPSSKLQSCGSGAPPGCQHVLLQGDPKTGVSQHIYHLPAGFPFAKHWHDSSEYLVVTKGSLRIAADGHADTTLNVGDYVHVPAKVVHWGACTTECEFYLMYDGPETYNVVEKN